MRFEENKLPSREIFSFKTVLQGWFEDLLPVLPVTVHEVNDSKNDQCLSKDCSRTT
jgi:hypothetical protein